MKQTLAVALTALLFGLAGCASYDPGGKQSATAGKAVYHYKKTADTCEVIITSAREPQGLNAQVDKNCAVTVSADVLSAEKLQLRMMDTTWMLVQEVLSRKKP